jgi:intracellular sulfur oxidation DsrE/DsrF family protein
MTFGGRAIAQTKAAAIARWEPTRHEQDNWMDELRGKHRLVIDTTTNDSLSDALLFANNFLMANRNSYGLQNSDLAVIVVARHLSTSFGFNNAMWDKYGAQLASGASVSTPSNTNPRIAGGFGIDALAGQGVQFAVCAMATARLANSIVQATGSSAEAITKELNANLIPNARSVPAGIVAINRAQERGYTLVTA